MKKFLSIALLLPIFIFAQQPKPKTTVKPKTTTTTTGKTTNGPKPKTTAVAATPKKPSPAVIKLVDKAYEYYKANKDKECEATVKEILVLDPKNKDAFMLRANMAMFAGKTDEIWKNLDIIYKNNPKEPEIYSQFAVNHLTYTFFSDSLKRVFCRKTILLASNYAEGYASLGLVAAVGGNYEEAVNYFNISFKKQWKDTNSRTILKLPYARCQYEMGQKEEAIQTISQLIPRLKGEDKYTCVYMRATYKMEVGHYDVKDDIDTLSAIYPNDIGVKKLTLIYFKHNGTSADSLCTMARLIREQSEENDFDISTYCTSLTSSLAVKKGSKLTYDMKGSPYIVEPTLFDYNQEIKFKWYRSVDETTLDTGNVIVSNGSLDSAIFLQNYFTSRGNDVLTKNMSIWLSRKHLSEIAKDSFTFIAADGLVPTRFYYSGHQQMEVLNSKNESMLLDCVKLFDGEETIVYLNDVKNPMIVKILLKDFTLVLTKFE